MHLANKGKTAYIPDLVGGSGISGRLNGYNAGSFPDLVSNAPVGSRVAILRLDTGPVGYDEEFQGFDFLLFVNLTCEEVGNPFMGLGAAAYLAPLQESLITMDPFFGGAGPKQIQSLEAYEIYATLVPTDATHLNVSFYTPGGFSSQSVEQLDLETPLYVGNSVAASCPGLDNIPAASVHRDPDPVQPPEPILSAMDLSFQGGVMVNIDGPDDAVWTVGPSGSAAPSGVDMGGLELSPVEIQFGTVPGWIPLRNQMVEILPDYDRAAYPLTTNLGEDSRVVLNVEYQPAPTLEIGSVAPKKVHAGDSLGFHVEPGATMVVEGDLPEGEILFQNGWFSYRPAPADRLPFFIRFTSLSDSDVTQVVEVQPIPDQETEEQIIELRSPTPPDPSGRDYVFVNTEDEVEDQTVTISGKDIVFSSTGVDGNGDSRLFDLVNDKETIKHLNLYGDKVVILEPLKLPGIEVTIYARELHFEDRPGQAQAVIDVTPKIVEGGSGLPSGTIRLHVGKLVSGLSSSPRFVLRGGAARENENGTVGSGGSGGVLEAPFADVEAFADFTGGAGSPNRGPAGEFQLLGDGERPLSYQWLHPLAARAVLIYAKDLYFMGYREEAEGLLAQYERFVRVTKNFTLLTDLPDADNALLQFEEIRQDMGSVLDRLAGHLDYFGNPPGWVPMLSFEVNYKLTSQEIERAMKFLYSSYWLGRKGNDIGEAQAAMGLAKEAMEVENTEVSEEYKELLMAGGPIDGLDAEIEAIAVTTGRSG